MFGDCSRCGHSVAYHMPFVGCVKCDCSEFHVGPHHASVAALLGLLL